ncbi:MarR family winged helix-turn-helix transcriptional regulator [Dactylosporangium sucinum]|uniref:HTH marR-type domain-containing protein n=1 Tax=Dactylosporangium sucinum TaxID=1424081 RepID=A0A917TU22_9ACTN|nr:MarR family transcriptional regulator [Dactylosporangium sucinum]GGM37591.1 hypothetical protein GCM10007977_043820 [Dactylosporangium sucinum]
MAQRNDEQDEQLAQALLALSRVMVALAARNLSELDADVTLPQYRALIILTSNGPTRSVDLAQELNVAPSTLTRMCDRLERKGLIRRFQRDGNRRTIWLGLTEEGRDVVGRVMRARRDEIDTVLATAGLHASRRTLQLLHRFVRAAGELPDEEWWQRWQVSADDGDQIGPERKTTGASRRH